MELETEVSGGVVRVRGVASPVEAAQYVAALAGMQGTGVRIGGDASVVDVVEELEIAPPRLFALGAAEPEDPSPEPLPDPPPTATMLFHMPGRHAKALADVGCDLRAYGKVREWAVAAGTRVEVELDSDAAVVVFEAFNRACSKFRGTVPQLYTTRKEFQATLDAHFGIQGEAG